MLQCYHFGNFYMSSIQQGIQAAHAQMEMFAKYNPATEKELDFDEQNKIDTLYDWAHNHKTMICLNGGAHEQLLGIEGLMEMDDNPYPWASFYEEPGAISGGHTLTNIAIVVPESIYDIATQALKNRTYGQYSFEYKQDGGGVVMDNANFEVPVPLFELNPFQTQLAIKLSECRLAG